MIFLKKTPFLIFIFASIFTYAQNFDTLVIRRIDKTIASFDLSLCVFNSISHPDSSNAICITNPSSNNSLTIINQDSIEHNFTIDEVFTSAIINPNDTLTVSFNLPEGSFRYYSNTAKGSLLGASGIIKSGFEASHNYYWNLFDAEESQNQNIASNLQNSINQPYTPEVFTINYNIYPQTTLDSTAKIIGNVGDSIIISIINSGLMTHPFHFHGYHIKILDSKLSQKYIGWEKDSFPVLPGDAMTVLLIPEKPGTFPVHDHNLITVTTGGYPGGMISIIAIQP